VGDLEEKTLNPTEEGQTGRQNPRHLVADELRKAIERGELSPGQKLPSGRDLSKTYDIARNTADDAIKLLQSEGLVDVKHGSGAYVRERRPLVRLGSNRYSQRLREETGLSPFLLEATRQGRRAHVEGREVQRIQPPQDVAERLNVSAETKSVIQRENWYFADDQPVQIGLTYIPWEIAKGTPLTKSGEPIPTGIYAYLESLGYTMTTIREEISARMPRHSEAAQLRVPPGVPIIEVLHTSISQDGTPFDVTRFVLRADVMGLDYTMPVEG
jgi:GntR family transcriptional regulator